MNLKTPRSYVEHSSHWCSSFLSSLLFLLSLALLSSGCKSLDIPSRWQDREITFDNRGGQFPDSLRSLDADETAMAVSNDGAFLYVNFRCWNNESVRQFARQGLTVWFDREGGESKKFGIHFPLGMQGGPRSAPGMPSRGISQVPGSRELEIIGPEGDRHRMTFAEAGSIDARFQLSNDTLNYMMKVPISTGGAYPFTIGAKPGSSIGVGIETAGGPGAEGRSGESSPGASMRGGGGGRGGRGGGGGGGGGGRADSPRSSLSVWGIVRLATEPSAPR